MSRTRRKRDQNLIDPAKRSRKHLKKENHVKRQKTRMKLRNYDAEAIAEQELEDDLQELMDDYDDE